MHDEEKDETAAPADPPDSEEPGRTFRIRLPVFINAPETGLGDIIKRTTTAFGIHPCGGCERRAAALNRRVVVRPTNRP